jgi:hypothetical protein
MKFQAKIPITGTSTISDLPSSLITLLRMVSDLPIFSTLHLLDVVTKLETSQLTHSYIPFCWPYDHLPSRVAVLAGNTSL